MKSIFEQMGGTYHQEGDYLIPDLLLPDAPDDQIGRYGQMRQRYLKEYRKTVYAVMERSGMLYDHLAEVDRTCNERMELMIRQMAECEGITEALKASDQMAWVGAMSNLRNRAEEIVLSEVVYA